ncbi:MAG: 3-phosphoshikimate 1-carboxyvinyltransferase [Spirochaetes bacterium]|nr:3-phosphoshikimate 1-carboxyvinyltransferase [Spirochaetota bacterium]
MKVKIKRSECKGRIIVPGSKSHTIRAVFIGSLASGRSVIKAPLLSSDTISAIHVCRAFGAGIEIKDNEIIISGTGGELKVPENIIDVGNSGTTLRIGLSMATLLNGSSVFTGDDQIRKRPLGSLINALNSLGAEVISTEGNGKAPVSVKGKATGGECEIEAVTSQYLSSLLINAPLYQKDTRITVLKLNERPYVDMTLQWLDKQNIMYENDEYKRFNIQKDQSYKPFKETIPGDFSSASFFLALGAMSENEMILENLDMSDIQGDKRIVQILKEMGANVDEDTDSIRISGGSLHGIDIDMNDIPDALPVMSVVGCFAKGTTRLLNVPQARLKETDRIRTMKEELSKMGADIEEMEDGLIINQSRLHGSTLTGHDDHRIVMALTIAGLLTKGETTVETAEAVNITFPGFFDLIRSCNGNIDLIEE